MSQRPLILGLGGTTRAFSSSEMALRMALAEAERLGAETVLLSGPELVLPLYAPENPDRTPDAARLVALLRRCDGVILSSPGYHGSISGLMKNALDYVEDTARDAVPYLDGRAVGCIACAYGWQATGSTLAALRSIAHALRGWPTPLGVAVNSMGTRFEADGTCNDAGAAANLAILAQQVVWFARGRQTPAAAA
ncbi:NADPH-dependent FMN reductase [Niveispirillum fermenti]|uniref:NADPH-dependent FMN reductase n=1 Tax=Niveispirillum fermenti TaxID=1233113 RepID=UPI003A8814CB